MGSKHICSHTKSSIILTDYRRITRFRVKHEGASQRGLTAIVPTSISYQQQSQVFQELPQCRSDSPVR